MLITKFISKVWGSFWAGRKRAVKKTLGERIVITDWRLLANYRTALELGNLPANKIIPITTPELEMLAILRARNVEVYDDTCCGFKVGDFPPIPKSNKKNT